MSNVRDDEDPFWVDDLDSIRRIARNNTERRQALDVCLEDYWPDESIGRIERLDTDDEHGWLMWRWRKEASG